MELTKKRCVPCEGGTPTLPPSEVQRYLTEVKSWRLVEDAAPKIAKAFTFDDFLSAMAFVDRIAVVAEAEGHHPDFCVHYSRVDVTIWTHAVKGLSENDFILAAKIDALDTR